jgi:4'-phosphopantetheinyl transferase
MRIDRREAHVWSFTTAVSEARLNEFEARLSEEERARARRIRHPATHSGFVVTRSALRTLLARYMELPESRLELRYTGKGKPALATHHEGELKFSVAHSAGVAMLAFALVDVGVDVERIRFVPRERRLSTRVFPEATRELIDSLPASHRQAAFFAAWTQREALVKAVGGALLATRDPLDFQWPHSTAPRQLTSEGVEGEHSKWTVAALPHGEGYAATLVAAGEIDEVRLLRYDAS